MLAPPESLQNSGDMPQPPSWTHLPLPTTLFINCLDSALMLATALGTLKAFILHMKRVPLCAHYTSEETEAQRE